MRYAALVLGLMLAGLMCSPSSAASPGDLTITVVVTDQNGAPIPEADVAFVAGSLITHYTADANGVFVAHGAGGNGAPINICATDESANGASTCVYGVVVPPSGGLTVSLKITPTSSTAPSASASPPRGWVFGTVTTTGSADPIPGVTVRLADTPVVTQTGPDGRYQFPAVSTTDGAGGGPTYTVAVTPPAGFVAAGSASQTVTVVAGQGAEADFTLAPAFVPFWVESFVPGATLWSGSDSKAVAFGARPQWSYFLVVASQRGQRLEVWDPSTRDYAWVDAAGVGPSGPPSP